MLRIQHLTICVLVFLLFICAVEGSAASTGKISGRVVDKATNEALPGVNVVVVGTSFGAATDPNGDFTIPLVPPGLHSVRASCIGYNPVVDSTVQVNDGQATTLNFFLDAVTTEVQTVVVTAQASGQNQAINQQLASPQITNVVSSARIQELPDANAAESVGRLPGVSLLRSGGEADQIVVRGLEPKYNSITVDGVKMASSTVNNRSADLSMITPNSLEGIEVIKSVTPDLDPDVLGGTVNFKMREAKGGKEGLGYNFLGEGGYNGLSDAYNKMNNYKYIGSVEGRFLESQLGVFAQADLERRNLSSNEFGGSYDHLANSTTDYVTTALNLNDVIRDRQRENGTLDLDYKLPDGKITFSNFGSTGITDVNNRQETFDVVNNLHKYSLESSNIKLNDITNAINIEKQLSNFHANLKLSHSYSETNDPNDWTVTFQNPYEQVNRYQGHANINPTIIPPSVHNSADSTFLSSIAVSDNYSRERALAAALDFDTPVNISDMVSGVIKFGGKYRYQTRSNLHDQTGTQGFGLTSANYTDSMIAARFGLGNQYGTKLPLSRFVDPNFNYGTFLNGDYPMSLAPNSGQLSDMANFVNGNIGLIAKHDPLTFFHDDFNSTTSNYDGNEDQSAGYAMATANIGAEVTVIGGVRYQNLQTSYTAPRGAQNTASGLGGPYLHYDTTITVDHSYWLPDLNVRYKPLTWFDLRLAYSNTLAYPDYQAIVPRIDVSTGNAIAWNNTQLNPTRSANWDAYGSFYENTIGLFTVGGFLKQIDGLIYSSTIIVSNAAAEPYYPPYLSTTAPKGQYTISTYVNSPNRINNYGMELDWQTHFWYLPHPFDGLVLNVNYTHVFSEATYPYVISLKPNGLHSQPVAVDTSYQAPLLYQPDRILNLSLGYDYSGFSIRLSMLYQADIYTGIPVGVSPVWLQLHTSTSSYTRWDVSVKQDLPSILSGFQVFGDINNLTGANDVSVIHAPTGVPASQGEYGLTADLGIRWKF